jgi:iron-sulfur cluster assembly accessory protein
MQAAIERAAALPLRAHITLTPAAAAHIQTTLATEPTALGLRVGVKKSGCTGYGYVMDFAKTIEADDLVFERFDVRLVCDATSLEILEGSTLDYVVSGLSRLLQFNNPNVVDSCGCGESFSIKETPAHG